MPPFKQKKERLCPCGCGLLCTLYYGPDGRFKSYSKSAPGCPTSYANLHAAHPGKIHRGPNNNKWKPNGSTRLHNSGDGKIYREIKVNGQWLYEHRYVMEQLIGRPLSTHEHVHHKNHQDTLNNHPDNLELLTHSEHATYHGKTRLAGWDAHPEGCLMCHTTTKKYSCKGYCSTCIAKVYKSQDPERYDHYAETSFLRNKEVIYARNRAYHHRVRKPQRLARKRTNPQEPLPEE
jgi:hypothetical protein